MMSGNQFSIFQYDFFYSWNSYYDFLLLKKYKSFHERRLHNKVIVFYTYFTLRNIYISVVNGQYK
jgi:hypothetical protein